MGKKISTFFLIFFHLPPLLLLYFYFSLFRLAARRVVCILIVVLSVLISISQGVGFTSSLSMVRFNSMPRPRDKLEA